MTGCTTPQIPLPPPDIGEIGIAVVDASQELVKLSSGPSIRTQGTIVYVINTETQYGTIAPANADGSFETHTFSAADGDEVSIDYRKGTEISDPLCLVIRYSGTVEECS